MLKSVTVTNHLGESLHITLAAPEQSGFAIVSIEGLGPSKANINSKELASMDGSIFNSSRVISRNIVISVQYLFSPTVEEVRLKSYKYFPIGKAVKLVIETDTRTSEIIGYVESNEPNMFSKDGVAQISIMCPDPNFYSLSKNVSVFSGIEPEFEFPFYNDSLNTNLIEIGEVVSKSIETLFYDGDSKVGVTIVLHAIGPATNVSIHNVTTRETIKIDTVKLAALTGSAILNRDDIIISTVKGDKYATLLRNGVYTNILNCIDKGSSWTQINKGDNLFAYEAETGASNLQFRIENRTAYEGV